MLISITQNISEYKYDVREGALYINSVASVREAKEFINRLLWVRKNIPF